MVLTRFRELPGGAVGRWLERAGARELPLLLTVLRGRLSFVGPRVVAARDRRRTHRAATADGAGPDRPAQLGASADTALDDAYVERWSLWNDAQLLAGRRPGIHHSVSNSSS